MTRTLIPTALMFLAGVFAALLVLVAVSHAAPPLPDAVGALVPTAPDVVTGASQHVDRSAPPWRHGAWIALGIVGAFFLLGALLRSVARDEGRTAPDSVHARYALLGAAALAGLGVAVDGVANGQAPNLGMLAGGVAAFAGILARSPRGSSRQYPRAPTERGSVHPLLAIALGVAVTAGSFAVWSCSSTARQTARSAAGALVDCAAGALASHDEQLVEMVRAAIRSGDWGPVRAAAPKYGIEIVGCTAAELVLEAPVVSGVAPGPDPRAGFETLRGETLEGRRFKTSSGEVL